eukprot:Sspe_Gene.82948::Locus_54382_Transcript_1_1_Confidence_1.000_Length_629::g.82948::m.82948/K02219/CKS1; cyclin-dependent kinase regulatory subunit CKS1
MEVGVRGYEPTVSEFLEYLRNPRVRRRIENCAEEIKYSMKYKDTQYEYRHIELPQGLHRLIPSRLLSEAEWRQLGVQQSYGWEHYLIHPPEPHILLFRRPLNYVHPRPQQHPQRALDHPPPAASAEVTVHHHSGLPSGAP